MWVARSSPGGVQLDERTRAPNSGHAILRFAPDKSSAYRQVGPKVRFRLARAVGRANFYITPLARLDLDAGRAATDGIRAPRPRRTRRVLPNRTILRQRHLPAHRDLRLDALASTGKEGRR